MSCDRKMNFLFKTHLSDFGPVLLRVPYLNTGKEFLKKRNIFLLLVKRRFEWRMNEGSRSSTKKLDRFTKLGSANGVVLSRGFPDRIHHKLSDSR